MVACLLDWGVGWWHGRETLGERERGEKKAATYGSGDKLDYSGRQFVQWWDQRKRRDWWRGIWWGNSREEEVDDEWWPEIRNYGCCLLVEIGRSGGGRLWWSMVRLWRMKKSYRHFSIFATFNNFNSMSSTWFVFLQNWIPSLSFYIYIWDFPFNLWDSTKAFLLIETFVNFNFQETKKIRIENRQ